MPKKLNKKLIKLCSGKITEKELCSGRCAAQPIAGHGLLAETPPCASLWRWLPRPTARGLPNFRPKSLLSARVALRLILAIHFHPTAVRTPRWNKTSVTSQPPKTLEHFHSSPHPSLCTARGGQRRNKPRRRQPVGDGCTPRRRASFPPPFPFYHPPPPPCLRERGAAAFPRDRKSVV